MLKSQALIYRARFSSRTAAEDPKGFRSSRKSAWPSASPLSRQSNTCRHPSLVGSLGAPYLKQMMIFFFQNFEEKRPFLGGGRETPGYFKIDFRQVKKWSNIVFPPFEINFFLWISLAPVKIDQLAFYYYYWRQIQIPRKKIKTSDRHHYFSRAFQKGRLDRPPPQAGKPEIAFFRVYLSSRVWLNWTSGFNLNWIKLNWTFYCLKCTLFFAFWLKLF